MVEWDNIAFELVDGTGVLDLAWSLACDGMGNVESRNRRSTILFLRWGESQ